MSAPNDHELRNAQVRPDAGGDPAGADDAALPMPYVRGVVDGRPAYFYRNSLGITRVLAVSPDDAICPKCGRPHRHLRFLPQVAAEQVPDALHGLPNGASGPERRDGSELSTGQVAATDQKRGVT